MLDLYITHATNAIKFTQLERQQLKRIRYEDPDPGDNLEHLVVAEQRRLPRRAARHDPVHPTVDHELHMLPKRPTIDPTRVIERGEQRGSKAGASNSTAGAEPT